MHVIENFLLAVKPELQVEKYSSKHASGTVKQIFFA